MGLKKLAYIVEDEENIRELIQAALSSGGYEPRGFEGAQQFWQAMEKQPPRIALLDIMLPGQSGLEILREMRRREEFRDIPVIFLTAKGSEIDKVKGLDLGADDYIVKPFGVLEMLSRVNAVMRRCGREPGPDGEGEHIYKDLLIDTNRKGIFRDGEQISLTFKEYELFVYLYKNRGIVLSRDRLLEQIWNYEYEGETRTVDSHIRSLRSKLGDDKNAPTYIKTSRGYGYQLLRD